MSSQSAIDPPEKILKSNNNDTTKLNLLVKMSEQCEETEILKYTLPALSLADKLLADKAHEKYKGRLLHQKALVANNIGFAYDSQGELDSAFHYYQRALSVFNETGDGRNIANVTSNLAGIYQQRGNIQLAIEYYRKCIALQERLDNTEGLAAGYNNLAGVFRQQGDIPKALEYYSKCLRLLEQQLSSTNDQASIKVIKQGIATSLINIGLIYTKQGDTIKSVECYKRSLALYEEIKDQSGKATALFNLGYAYRISGDIKKGLEYYDKSLEIRKKIGDKEGVAFSLHNIGFIHQLQGRFAEGLDYFFKALDLRRSIGNKIDLTYSHTSIADLLLKMGRYNEATLHSDTAFQIAHDLGFPESLRNAERILAKIDSAKGNYAGALTHYQQYILYRDSINNEGTRKASIKNQLSYEFEKKEAVLKEQQEKERILAEEKNRVQNIITIAAVICLLLMTGFAVYVWRSLKITHRQKELIEEKQKEIVDSIYYARRIQRSLLPNEKFIQAKLRQLKELF
jgi:tetratricopeptide (TPR) repeat protein